ncbi:biopolymer transporter ExbD [Bacteroides sp.]|uniref:ExbD/TolR family protein n=1 Tax=Bacteroides sp. TaxID=29523 RepID=UPI002637D5A5|nr:biopolymer transporter ExbD [Bacteroides sp.]MDD3039345.1 biopolymer transporter ExbD [Bacteroides sp.]
MGRAQIKKKSTFIDMTAMSDVTVLLLTFFMLTSAFVKKEPVTVNTPASVSEIKIPEKNVLQILIDPAGKVFMSLDKQQDMQAVLESMGNEYGIKFTPEQEKKFIISPTFGVPIGSMKQYLDLPEDQQDKILKNEGIPCDSTDNQFKSWVRNARAANADLRIAIKADASTPYSVIKNVMNSLQDLRENRYNLITTLKGSSEE